MLMPGNDMSGVIGVVLLVMMDLLMRLVLEFVRYVHDISLMAIVAIHQGMRRCLVILIEHTERIMRRRL